MMIGNPSKLFMIGCSLLSLLLCVIGVATLSWYKQTTECFKERSPLQSFVLTIDQNQQRLLFDQSQKFADLQGFSFDFVYYTPQGDHFTIQMTRKDVEVVISNTSFDLDRFYVSFVNYDCIHPTVASDIDGLSSDLKSFLREIPNVTITEEK